MRKVPLLSVSHMGKVKQRGVSNLPKGLGFKSGPIHYADSVNG